MRKPRPYRDRREYSKKYRRENPLTDAVHAARTRAREDGVEHTITQEWSKLIWMEAKSLGCLISGLPFIPCERGPFSPSIDRIVPENGYTPENCRIILNGINGLKHTGTDEDVFTIAYAIVENMTFEQRESAKNNYKKLTSTT